MIRFSDKQWDNLKNNYRLWWKGELHRPILPIKFYNLPAGRDRPKNELLLSSNCADLSITPEQIVDRYDYELSTFEFFGDSFPVMHMCQFGPSVLAAFLGAELNCRSDTVWFSFDKKIPIKDLHFEYDSENIWWRRIKDIYKAGMKKWGGEVIMGMTDLGGILDILPVFRTTEGLLTDLYDEPQEVKRLILELQSIWFKYFNEINEITKGSRGYTQWSSIFTEEPSYMLQSDFSYMLGPTMFNEFVLDEIENTASRLKDPFYHLDGKGQLCNLDRLLRSKFIKGIQWVPGSGNDLERDWSDVFHKIALSGKKIFAFYGLDMHFDDILNIIDKPDYLIKAPMYIDIKDKEETIKKLQKRGFNI